MNDPLAVAVSMDMTEFCITDATTSCGSAVIPIDVANKFSVPDGA